MTDEQKRMERHKEQTKNWLCRLFSATEPSDLSGDENKTGIGMVDYFTVYNYGYQPPIENSLFFALVNGKITVTLCFNDPRLHHSIDEKHYDEIKRLIRSTKDALI